MLIFVMFTDHYRIYIFYITIYLLSTNYIGEQNH